MLDHFPVEYIEPNIEYHANDSKMVSTIFIVIVAVVTLAGFIATGYEISKNPHRIIQNIERVFK